MMTSELFWPLFIGCVITMVLCRVVPAFVLRGRQLSKRTQTCLNLIAPCAFASLVANDLFSTTMFDSGIWAGVMPLISALVVICVAKKSSSLVICALTGVGIYGLLYYFVAL